MKNLSSLSTKNVLVVLAILAASVAATALYTYNNPSYPKFSFDENAAEGWWSTKNINLQDVAGSNYKGDIPKDELPVADMTIRHGVKDADMSDDECFLLYSYYNFTLPDIEGAYDDYEKRKEDGTLRVLDPRNYTIATHESEKEFELRRYEYTIEGKEVLSGYQIGFMPLSSGHIRVEGVCKTPEDLNLTLPAMQAVKLLER